MGQVRGGSYSIGTKDGAKVYLGRYTGPEGTGTLIFNMELPPAEAREIGQALIDQANKIDPKSCPDCGFSTSQRSAQES